MPAPSIKPTTVIGFLGTTLDAAKFGPERWNRWRPSVGLTMHEDLRVDRFVLLHSERHQRLADRVTADITDVSPETEIAEQFIEFDDPWDFEEVYTKLLDFARSYPFDPDNNDYLIHITTGTHVAQICLFLLTEARFLPGKLLQTQPRGRKPQPVGTWDAIDLDLSRYDSIATRFAETSAESAHFLKSGIETRNAAFNRMIEEIEQVATRSRAAILLMGTAISAASAQYYTQERMVEGRLVSDHRSVSPGSTFRLGFHQTIEPGWHTYWRNPGDSGDRIRFDYIDIYGEGSVSRLTGVPIHRDDYGKLVVGFYAHGRDQAFAEIPEVYVTRHWKVANGQLVPVEDF